MKSMLPLSFIIFMLFVISGCSADSNCRKVVNSKCINCHSLNKLCKQKEKNDKYWERIVDQMKRLRVAVSDTEKKEIVNCLAGNKHFDDICL